MAVLGQRHVKVGAEVMVVQFAVVEKAAGDFPDGLHGVSLGRSGSVGRSLDDEVLGVSKAFYTAVTYGSSGCVGRRCRSRCGGRAGDGGR